MTRLFFPSQKNCYWQNILERPLEELSTIHAHLHWLLAENPWSSYGMSDRVVAVVYHNVTPLEAQPRNTWSFSVGRCMAEMQTSVMAILLWWRFSVGDTPSASSTLFEPSWEGRGSLWLWRREDRGSLWRWRRTSIHDKICTSEVDNGVTIRHWPALTSSSRFTFSLVIDHFSWGLRPFEAASFCFCFAW